MSLDVTETDLEDTVTLFGIVAVKDALVQICDAKADHARETLHSESQAILWDLNAHRLSNLVLENV